MPHYDEFFSAPAKITIKSDYVNYSQYKDLESNEWYKDGVAYCLDWDLIGGRTESVYGANDLITRSEVITALHKATGETVADITDNPNAPVTRQQLGTMIYRAAVAAEPEIAGPWALPLPVEDAAEIESWADEAMHYCYTEGLITESNGLINPNATVTKAQAAVVLERFLNK